MKSLAAATFSSVKLDPTSPSSSPVIGSTSSSSSLFLSSSLLWLFSIATFSLPLSLLPLAVVLCEFWWLWQRSKLTQVMTCLAPRGTNQPNKTWVKNKSSLPLSLPDTCLSGWHVDFSRPQQTEDLLARYCCRNICNFQLFLITESNGVKNQGASWDPAVGIFRDDPTVWDP